MIKTRGGQGTAENYIPDLPNLKVGLDIDHRTRIHLINILRDMQANRYTKNEALEKNKKERDDKKRSRPDNGPDKRVTIRDTLAEIDMFQTEHLKLREFVQKQQQLIANLHKRLKTVEALLTSHLQMDGSPAPSADVISSAILSTSASLESRGSASLKDDIEEVDKMCLACNKVVRNCKCFDD